MEAASTVRSSLVHSRNGSHSGFLEGLVFGFDVGTGSIGWAVRQGAEFKDVGVLICPEETSKLDVRRGLRSQRRRLRNRQRVREWFSKQLENLGLPSPYVKSEDERVQVHPKGQPGAGQTILRPGLDYRRICDPVLLRCEALQGRLVSPEELDVALTQLWKLRGKTNVPWKHEEKERKSDEQKKEEKKIQEKLSRLAKAMADGGFKCPCQLPQHRQQRGIKQHDEVWPRDEFQNKDFNLKQEFLAILENQSSRFPSSWATSRISSVMSVGFQSPANRADRAGRGFRWARGVEQGPVTGAFSRKG